MLNKVSHKQNFIVKKILNINILLQPKILQQDIIAVNVITVRFCYDKCMTFNERLREEIEYKGIVIKEISAKIGISNNTFLSYINSRNVMPNVETAVKIAKALDVSVEYLVTGVDSFYSEKNKQIKEITRDLSSLDLKTLESLKKMIHALT